MPQQFDNPMTYATAAVYGYARGLVEYQQALVLKDNAIQHAACMFSRRRCTLFTDARRRYPNLVELLKAQGVEPREPLVMPYRCKT